ncbi:ribose 5-phosphate isomerase B [Porcipelethomonas sp.]|uniref:ribose 5-phosphate isomerase B n=1 Tax=Porcipelethomonas sp. TaxID=2981675 RepID=UPI003EF44A0A
MIAIGCDHAGYELKKEIIKHLTEKGYELLDIGCNGESCDYPVIAKEVADNILNKKCDLGILICGTGAGMSIAANKVHGIRAALCSDYYTAKYTRLHNNSNVLCLGARTIGMGSAMELVDVFLTTEFEGGRHQRRIDLITEIENNNK